MQSSSTIVARCALVLGAAIATAVAGTAPVGAAGRAAVVVLLVVAATAAVRVRPPTVPVDLPTLSLPDLPAFDELIRACAADDGHGDAQPAVPPAATAPDAVHRCAHVELVVGHRSDGAPLAVPLGGGIAVVGRGAVAWATFEALVDAASRCLPDGHRLRVARAGEQDHPMPHDIAVAIAFDASTRVSGSIVLVPTDDRRPSRSDTVVLVGPEQVRVMTRTSGGSATAARTGTSGSSPTGTADLASPVSIVPVLPVGPAVRPSVGPVSASAPHPDAAARRRRPRRARARRSAP